MSSIMYKAKNESFQKPVVLFKHSTRCSISSMAKGRLERSWSFPEKDVTPYYLDLIKYRAVSNEIADLFHVRHESPQLLLMKNGEVVFHTSHNDIRSEVLVDYLQ